MIDVADVPGTNALAAELLHGLQSDLARLSQERDEIATAAAWPATLLNTTVAWRAGRVPGIWRAEVGDFLLTKTYDEHRYCACHVRRVGQCDSPTIQVITQTVPRISVKRKDAKDDE